ncbi:MAG: nucleotide exchange factor GrpE [Chloroherpetonaceae bacterium]|nr:nucleotide exchange factor GrpE [Chloroherpetonaceae bacterium]MDW8437119.1 nucleotide exchange factor GrpE [Chloroherpetonaceae bacterium]
MSEELKIEANSEPIKNETTETVAADAQPTETEKPETEKSELDVLKEKLAQVEQERDHFKDQLYRRAADYENFRRQKEREMSAFLKFAEEGIIKKLLPTLDDLERVIKNAEKFLANNPDAKIYVDGVKLVQQKLFKTLEERGVSRIESLGKKFDINYHEALTQAPRTDVEPDTIVEEFEAGYMLHDKVIRHAKVVVAKAVEEEQPQEQPKAEEKGD